jgi:hypothetical protein
MQLSALYVYPVKALGPVAVAAAEVGEGGFVDDRRFMVVGEDDRFVTQREAPRLALVAARLEGDRLRLEAPGAPPLELPRLPSGAAVTVEVWGDRVAAVEAGGAAFFSDFLGRPARLVFMPEGGRRQVAGDRAFVGFADGYPFLLTSTGSLAALAAAGAPVPMLRFRPNLVVDGAPAWAEDGWRRLRIGAVEFDVMKPCARCVVTTIDPATAQAGAEPLRTLARLRRVGNEVHFGQNLCHRGRGLVRAGDPVEVLA